MRPFLNAELAGFTREADNTLAGDGTMIKVNFFSIPPDLPAGFGDPARLQRAMTLLGGQQGGTVVEVGAVSVGGLPALWQILKFKLPNQATGQAFLGSLTVPRANCSAVLRVFAQEGNPTGVREAIVMAQIGPDKYFMPHPFAPDAQLPLPFHAADNPAYDAQFPDHPLTRVRRVMAQLAQQVTMEPEFAAQPPFDR